ncbi:MAG: MBL fold metallo-hydrolase [Patescibacteria group bacterium]|nr:MBL fold metallo-hydrolase [Patescibacteria group bacterium]
MFKEIIEKINIHKPVFVILTTVFLVLDIFIYSQIFALDSGNKNLELYFLNVGQGDSELVVLPGGVKVLIDGGPLNSKVLEGLSKALPVGERYIDLVILSHPEIDHFGGLIDVVRRYKIGAFIWNGEQGEARAFQDLKSILVKNDIETIALGVGDSISYQNSHLNVLSPHQKLLKSKSVNEKTLVLLLSSNNSRTVFAGDINEKIEKQIVAQFDSRVDVLKVAHHGSKFSSSANFLSALRPKIAVIEVGKNSYGHPAKTVLDRLAEVGARVFRTDENGTTKLTINNGSIKVFYNIAL